MASSWIGRQIHGPSLPVDYPTRDAMLPRGERVTLSISDRWSDKRIMNELPIPAVRGLGAAEPCEKSVVNWELGDVEHPPDRQAPGESRYQVDLPLEMEPYHFSCKLNLPLGISKSEENAPGAFVLTGVNGKGPADCRA